MKNEYDETIQLIGKHRNRWWSLNELRKRGGQQVTAIIACGILLAVLIISGPLSNVLYAQAQIFLDPGGDTGVDGKSDLNGVSIEYTAETLEIDWYYDNQLQNGSTENDKGACVDLDTDGDLYVNYAVCYDPDSNTTYLFTCDNSKLEGCTSGATEVELPATCTESYVDELDPSSDDGIDDEYQEDTDQDTKISCSLDYDLFDVSSGADLGVLNVCTVQAESVGAMGTSQHKDCALRPQGTATITLVKVVQGGDAIVSDFTLSALDSVSGAGPSGISGTDDVTAVSVLPGTYNLSESGIPITNGAYDLTSLTCNDGSDTTSVQNPSVTLDPGDDVTCTFTNNLQTAKLTLVKRVINDNGGNASPIDYTLTADGTDTNDLSGNPTNAAPCTDGTANCTQGSISADDLIAGIFTLSESPNPGTGYTASQWSCNGGSLSGSQLTLQPGDDVTCTITNTDDAPSLTLVKVVTNDNGGMSVASDWTLTAAGYDPADPQTGTYDLSESGPDDYTLTSLTCDNATGQVTSVTLGLGEDVTCTFVNDDDAPLLTLVKVVNNDNGGMSVASDWTLTAAGYDPADPQTGTYDLSESGPDDYTLTSLTCDNATGQVTSVTLGLGEDVTCTFVNDDDAPLLTLVKVVNNDNGGMSVASDWTLTAAGYDPADPQTGTYDLSESGPDDYTLTSLTCDNATGQVTSVTLGLGEDVTCTFVNDDDAPLLTLVKVVNNDNGGMSVASDWTLTAAGYDPADPQTGTYDLSESGPDDYTLTSLTCDNATGQVTSVTLGLGEDVTCTFVNDDDAPLLTLVKVVNNDNGGMSVASDWTLTAAGYDPADPQTGTYDLSESGPDDYTLTSLTCDNATGQVTSVTLGLGEDVTCTFVNDDDAPLLTLVKVVNNDNGGMSVASDWTLTAAGYDPADPQTGTYDLSESGPDDYTLTSLTCDNATGQVTSVTLGLGEDVTCTFVNDDDAPLLTLVKVVNNDNGGMSVASDWTLTAAGYDPADPQTGTYDLSESGPDDYTLTSLTCDNATGQVTSVTLGLGEDVTCTFVNDDIAPTLVVVKDANPANGTDFSFSGTGGTGGLGDFTLDDADPDDGDSIGDTQDFGEVMAGVYQITEALPFGWILSSATCVGDSGEVAITDGVEVTLEVGDDVVCTFTNSIDISMELSKDVAAANFFDDTPDPGDPVPNYCPDYNAPLADPSIPYHPGEPNHKEWWYEADSDGHSAPLLNANELACYRITIENTGSVPITNISLRDDPYYDWGGSQAAQYELDDLCNYAIYDADGDLVGTGLTTLGGVELPPGGVLTCIYTVIVSGDAYPHGNNNTTFNNKAQASGDYEGISTTSNSDQAFYEIGAVTAVVLNEVAIASDQMPVNFVVLATLLGAATFLVLQMRQKERAIRIKK